jgi:hypothetical protein
VKYGNTEIKMKKLIVIAGAALILSACAQKSAYEAAVEDLEPSYCYQSIGGVTCYKTPYHRDERRLVNYFGPAPVRYDKPEPVAEIEGSAPEAITYWVKDPEPVPTISAKGDLIDRPWLSKTPVQALEPQIEEGGLSAFLRDIRTNSMAAAPAGSPKTEAQTF